jgi:hypothetical protein
MFLFVHKILLIHGSLAVTIADKILGEVVKAAAALDALIQAALDPPIGVSRLEQIVQAGQGIACHYSSVDL